MTPLDDLDADSIDAQAARWFSRNLNDPCRKTRKAFALWRKDRQNARAYHQLEQLWNDIEALKQARRPAPPAPPPAPRWRPVLSAATAVLCVVVPSDLASATAPIQSPVVTEQGQRPLPRLAEASNPGEYPRMGTGHINLHGHSGKLQ